VALFIAACIFVRNTFYLAYAYSRQFSYTYLHYIWAVYGIPTQITTFCIAGGWVLKAILPASNILLLAFEVAGVLGSYMLLNWLFLIPVQIKHYIFSFVVSKIKSSPPTAKPPSVY
jgi:hypothetical protein